MGRVTLQGMDNVGIVVESLDVAISFFAELGLELEGRATIEGDWIVTRSTVANGVPATAHAT